MNLRHIKKSPYRKEITYVYKKKVYSENFRFYSVFTSYLIVAMEKLPYGTIRENLTGKKPPLIW